jgi:branched-chain amino acid aminotransferase
MKLVFLNGDFVPEHEAVVSVFDRCFLYGDGLFEAVRIRNSEPFLWDKHFERLEQGAEFLGIHIPYDSETLREAAAQLVIENGMHESVLRLTLSRGVGVRGYSPKGADKPVLVMTLHQAPRVDPEKPVQWRLTTASLRLPANDPLARYKTCNKLAQIMARAEAEAAETQEALLLNTDGMVVEAASSNLFWLKDGAVCTPPLEAGVLAGVTRGAVMEICEELRLKVSEANIQPANLLETEGVFLSLSSICIAEGISLDGKPLPRSPLTTKIYAAFTRLLRGGQ